LGGLITPAYAAENARLHAVDPKFGAEGYLWAYMVAGIARIEGCRTVLDYGCGKGTLARALEATDLLVGEYDPGVPGKDVQQDHPSDLVVCLDVMEHIEPECFEAVMADLKRLAGKLLFVVAVTKLSKRIMADGRDTHLSLHDNAWWAKQFTARGFRIRRVWNTGLQAWVCLMDAPC
jgi:hypothetical protein